MRTHTFYAPRASVTVHLEANGYGVHMGYNDVTRGKWVVSDLATGIAVSGSNGRPHTFETLEQACGFLGAFVMSMYDDLYVTARILRGEVS